MPRAEFGALWVEAERLNDEKAGRTDPDWYPAGVAVTCEWLASAVVEDPMGRRELSSARRSTRASEAAPSSAAIRARCSPVSAAAAVS